MQTKTVSSKSAILQVVLCGHVTKIQRILGAEDMTLVLRMNEDSNVSTVQRKSDP